MDMNVMTLPQAQEAFVELMRKVDDPVNAQQFLKWIQWNWLKDNRTGATGVQEDILSNIASDIRNVLPPEAIVPSEVGNIRLPSIGENSKLDTRHTIHVDGFLYDDDIVDELCEDDKMSRNYCLDCGSHRTKPITFISHSASRERLRYIFTALLGPLNEKTILDVGSRLGPILYGAYLFSNAAKIVGIEMNKELCEIQRGIIRKYNFQDRIQVIEGNLLDSLEVVQGADVIVLNNVFEFFMPPATQVLMWKFLKNSITSGSILVTVPALDVSLKYFKEETGIDLDSWVKELPPFNSDIPGIEDLETEIEEVKLYVVL